MYEVTHRWASCFYYQLPLPAEALQLKQARNYSFVLMEKQQFFDGAYYTYSPYRGLEWDDVPAVNSSNELATIPEDSPTGGGANGMDRIPKGLDAMPNNACGQPHPHILMQRQLMYANDMMYDEEVPLRMRSNLAGTKGMMQVSHPRPEHTEHRQKVELKVEQEMDECLFTLKCKIYKQELQKLVKEFMQDESQRFCINSLRSCATLRMNSAEKDMLRRLGDYTTIMARREQLASTSPENTKTVDEVLTEVLNSLSNRLLFYLLIEYRSWFPQDRARSQIVSIVLSALFPENLARTHEICPDLIKYIESFVIQRTKNFRDVISRVCKREKFYKANQYWY